MRSSATWSSASDITFTSVWISSARGVSADARNSIVTLETIRTRCDTHDCDSGRERLRAAGLGEGAGDGQGTSSAAGQRPVDPEAPGWRCPRRPKFQGIALPWRWACFGVGTLPDHRFCRPEKIRCGRPFSGLWALPTRALPTRGGHTPSDLLTVGPTTSMSFTRRRREGARSSVPHCSGPGAPHTLPHAVELTERRYARTSGSPRSAQQLTTEAPASLLHRFGLWRRRLPGEVGLGRRGRCPGSLRGRGAGFRVG